MTPAELQSLAEQAREQFQRSAGLPATPWHLAPAETRDAWRMVAGFIVGEALRADQRRRHSEAPR